MKAFLMYKDRDFDPQQLLARRERDLRHRRGNEQGLELRQILPWNEGALRQDLGVDVLCQAMAQDDRFLYEVVRVAILSSVIDVDTIRYRQHACADCSKNEEIIRLITKPHND
jgi:hypothetical protein